MVQAAIFDMDGLLIDSEPFWRQSHVNALAQYGVTINEDDVRSMAGKRTDEVVRHWRENYGLTHISNKHLEADIVAMVIGSIEANGKKLPGVESVINMFAAHSLPMAVASSSAPEIIDTVLNKLSLAAYMKLAYSAKNEKFGKPHPAVFLTTAKKLGAMPRQCVVFEDSLSGVRAAKAAGMKCIAIPEHVNLERPEFKEADLILSSLEQVEWSNITNLFK